MFKEFKEKISAFIALLKTNADKDVKAVEEAVVKETEAVLHAIIDGWESSVAKIKVLEDKLAAVEAQLEAVAAAPAIQSDVPAKAETPAETPATPEQPTETK